MAAITRTFCTYEITAYVLGEENPPVISQFASAVAIDTSMNDRKARIALRDNGVSLPKECFVKFVEGEQLKYSMSVERFIANANIVNI